MKSCLVQYDATQRSIENKFKQRDLNWKDSCIRRFYLYSNLQVFYSSMLSYFTNIEFQALKTVFQNYE